MTYIPQSYQYGCIMPYGIQQCLFAYHSYYGAPFIYPPVCTFQHQYVSNPWRPVREDASFHNASALVPNWLYESIRFKLSVPELVKKEDINLMKFKLLKRMTTDSEEVDFADLLAAYTDLNGHEGIFVLYEKVGNDYREVYEKRNVVVSVQVFYDALVLTVKIGGGTGVLEYEHYVIRYASRGIKEAWNGVAVSLLMNPEATPLYVLIATVTLFDNKLYHLLVKESYEKHDLINPASRECSCQIYTYDVSTERYDWKSL